MFARNLKMKAALLSSATVLPILFGGAALAQTADSSPANQATGPGNVQELVVTATRRAESISKVPQSITAYSEQTLDKEGVKNIDDLTRLTPGLLKTTGTTTTIAIRGVASAVGTSPTGVYIDDTPVQSRALAFFYSSPYPEVFDLSRVEVLRGPQGTLFGAGSEGGTVRFIFPTPSFTSYSGFGRAEVSSTQGGDISYEAGVAAGGPIIQDKLAIRADIFHRRDGGYIDYKTGSFTTVDATGNSGPSSLNFVPGTTIANNANWTDTTSGRIALAWKPIEGLLVTPSVYFQSQFTYDQVVNWLAAPTASNPGASQFTVLQNVGVVDATHNALPNFIPNHFPLKDQYTLPALKIDYTVGKVELVSNTSYLSRTNELWSDYTQSYETSYAGRKFPVPGDEAASVYEGYQKNFDQEVRIQSADDSRLKYVVGAFFSDENQLSNQTIYPNFVTQVPTFLTATANGPPFGPGTSAYVNYYGTGLVNGYSYLGQLKTHDQQIAGFTQLDFKITPKLTFTAGVREAYFKLALDAFYNGPSTNTNAPQGKACVPNTNPCVPVAIGAYAPGAGPFVPQYTVSSTTQNETSTTPKFALAYQMTPSDLFYASASQGFRPGGAQQLLPSTCNVQLAQYGYVNSNGIGTSPQSYQSDSLWSYEVGAKDSFFGGKVQTAASAYYIDWSNIQTSVRISTCNQTLTDNLGHASGEGGDFTLHLRPTSALTLDGIFGYNTVSFQSAVVRNSLVIYTKGSAVPGSPAPWQFTLSGQYDFHVMDGLYVRADYTHTAQQRVTATTDPGSATYVIGTAPVPATDLVNGRMGVTIKTAEFNIFANNIFNAHPDLSLTRSANAQTLWTDSTFRPRTVGVQILYHYN
jgi:outer membrane receptor protein involved in Fe transport